MNNEVNGYHFTYLDCHYKNKKYDILHQLDREN